MFKCYLFVGSYWILMLLLEVGFFELDENFGMFWKIYKILRGRMVIIVCYWFYFVYVLFFDVGMVI